MLRWSPARRSRRPTWRLPSGWSPSEPSPSRRTASATPAAARAFGRPYREVAGRLRRWEATGRVLRDDEPAVYLHEYTAGGHHRARPRGRARHVASRGRPGQPGRASPRGDLPPPRARPRRPDARRCGSTRRRSCSSTAGPADVRAVVKSLLDTAALRRFTDRGGPAAPRLAAPGRRTSRPSRESLAERSSRDRRRPPPVRRLPAAPAGSSGHRLGPRPRHARRPGRHPALPRRHPPGAAPGAAVGARGRRGRRPALPARPVRARSRWRSWARTPWPSPTDEPGPPCASPSPTTGARSRPSTTRCSRASGR